MSMIPADPGQPDARTEWQGNWPIVAASTLGYGVSVIHIYSLGIMIGPLEEEFGWSRAQITSGYLIVSASVFLFSSLAGMAIDRFGPRRLALTGALIYSLAISMLSLARQEIWIWWLLWLPVAAGALLLKPTVWVAAISSLFKSSRGVALAVALSASGVVSSIAPLLTDLLVQHFGWRMAYIIWGATAAGLALPVLFLFFSSAMDRDRKATQNRQKIPPGPNESHALLGKSIRSPVFLKLTAVSCIMALIFSALIVGLVPIMTSLGIDRTSAAAIAGVVGVTQIFGRLTCGFLLDRYDARRITATVVCFPVVTCLAYMLFDGSIPMAIVAALFFGLSVGAELDAIAYLASRYFGTINFGALFGTVIGLTALGGGLGPFLSSLIYDWTGSYTAVLWSIIPLTLVSAYLLLTLGAYPNEDRRKITD